MKRKGITAYFSTEIQTPKRERLEIIFFPLSKINLNYDEKDQDIPNFI